MGPGIAPAPRFTSTLPMPNIIVEDGSLPVGANSFVDVAGVAAWAVLRGQAWQPANTAAGEAAVLEAADYLRNEQRYIYRGSRKTAIQLMPFPRTGASEFRGPELPDTYVSWRLVEAQCALAVRALASPGTLQQDLARGGMVKSTKVDTLSVEYAESAPADTLLQAVQGLLQPLLLVQGSTTPVPYQSSPVDPPELTHGQYDDPSPSAITDLTGQS